MKSQLLCRIMKTISEASLKNNVRTGKNKQCLFLKNKREICRANREGEKHIYKQLKRKKQQHLFQQPNKTKQGLYKEKEQETAEDVQVRSDLGESDKNHLLVKKQIPRPHPRSTESKSLWVEPNTITQRALVDSDGQPDFETLNCKK